MGYPDSYPGRKFQETMNKFYTGIGARKTPEEILSAMTRKVQELDSKGFILRSGAQ